MKPYPKSSNEFNVIYRSMSTNTGYKLNDTYKLKLDHGNRLTLINPQGIGFTLDFGPTTFCCGVGQIGNFFDSTNPVPDDVLLETFKIIISILRNINNRGIVQAWFYKQKSQKIYYHPTIQKMCSLGGMKAIGKASFNPNSGNTVKGYQMTIPRG